MYLRIAFSYKSSLNGIPASSLTRVHYYLWLDSNLSRNNSLSRPGDNSAYTTLEDHPGRFWVFP